jgi:hypothetical protein
MYSKQDAKNYLGTKMLSDKGVEGQVRNAIDAIPEAQWAQMTAGKSAEDCNRLVDEKCIKVAQAKTAAPKAKTSATEVSK